ncbi:hypothetical protein N7466_010052 [Penicillium verhagenii]|uniref:uncharacterized protein n=1 Tax=Penicillium verhagenii TaxID=1562060 RepID=UPI002545ADCE|nr:uncharacterized protein N7466_010052 [Penicillium verhagenii]KAJ5919109.1 hypothetical protein N7466_010052 [Penicillium verhagenii]
MDEKNETEYVPLVTSELDYSRYWVVDDKKKNSKSRCSSLCLWLLLFELANVACFIGGYLILMKPRAQRQPQLDDYGSLSQFNRTWDYSNHSTFGESGSSYHETWDDMASHHGIVSVTKEWAAQHDLPPSAPTPDTPGELVYQVDGFHAMHCLHMIRENLEKKYLFDHHTRHCLEYIRHTLMCNVDITLAGMDKDNLLGAETSYAMHTCRDYDAIRIKRVQFCLPRSPGYSYKSPKTQSRLENHLSFSPMFPRRSPSSLAAYPPQFLTINFPAPSGWRYSPGDTIIGNVIRKSSMISPHATLHIWLTGITSVKIWPAGTSQSNNSRETYTNKWTLLDAKENLIFSGPVHHPEDCEEPLGWSFSVPIPSKPRTYITQGHQPHASFVPFGQDHPAYNILPGSLRTFSTGSGARSEARIEYNLHARLQYEKGGSKMACYAAIPIILRNPPGNVDRLHFAKGGGLSSATKVQTQRLLPGMEDHKASFRQKANTFFGSSKIPVFWFKVCVESPSVVQLDNPQILPICLSIETLKGNGHTSKVIEDAPQQIQINYIKILVRSSTTVIAPGNQSSSAYTNRQDSEVDFHFDDVMKKLESPLMVRSSHKDNADVDLGSMFQLLLRRNGLYANGKRCSPLITRALFPDCSTFNIKHTHQFEYRINLTLAGKTLEVNVFAPVRIIEAA